MAESYYYLVDFEATCEECGRRFCGVIAKEVPVNDSALAGSTLNSLADQVDAVARKKAVEKTVRERRWADLDLCYGLTEHECPHCFERQSWDPMEKPKEPQQKVAVGDQAMGLGCFVLFGLVAGVIVGLVLTIVQLILLPDLAFGWGFGIGVGMCAIAGVVLGIQSNKEDAERTESTTDEHMQAYQRDLAAYDHYQQRLKDNPTRNEPLVNLSSGRFASSLEATYAKRGLDPRDF